MIKTPELLAPAGTLECVRAAVNGGANAVYFGGKAFNARRGAVNMTEEEMVEAIALCRSRNVKVYVTLNILIKDVEIQALMDYLNQLAGLNIDGLIVQDIGLIYLLKKYFPGFKLQTSTQGAVYGLEGVLFFEKEGFQRVVLPREMALSEAASIREKAKTELKIFCHGALCYAYSGQCLMSSMIGGRSGNRGLCAQPCRKRYRLLNKSGQLIKQGYLLSPKDLKIKEELKTVVATSMDALKIEGRMKKPGYVYATTRAYRDALDTLAGKKNEPFISEQELAQVFNRSFTKGHLLEDPSIIGDALGRNRGIKIGTVLDCDDGKILVEPLPNMTFCVGDGLSFGVNAETGMRVDVLFDLKHKKLLKAKPGQSVKMPCRFKVAPGTEVFRNLDAALSKRLEDESTKTEEIKEIPLDFSLKLELNKPVTGKVKKGHLEIAFQSEITPAEAQNNPLSHEMLMGQFERLGGTPYSLKTFTADLEPALFLSKGEMNNLRREALEALETTEKAAQQKMPKPVSVKLEEVPELQPPVREKVLSLELTTLEDLEAYCGMEALDELVIPITELENPEAYGKAITLAKEAGKTVLLAFPKIMNTKESQALKPHLKAFLGLGSDGVLIRNYEMLNLLEGEGVYKEVDQSFNIFNGFAMKQLKAWNIDGGVLSPELTGDEGAKIAKESSVSCVVPIYGRQLLMVSANCLYNCDNKQCEDCNRYAGWSELVDERGAKFPVRKDEENRIYIYNGDVLFLQSDLQYQENAHKWRLYATTETPNTIKEVADYYRIAMDTGSFKSPPQNADVRYTNGNYRRGVE